jgi:tRNA-specific 2-thiouridylase
VIDIDPATSSVIVGESEDLIVDAFEVDRATWHGAPEGACELTVKIRYGHAGATATVTPLDGERAHVRLHVPQRAVTPGQAAVFYDRDRVAGGGWICRSEPARVPEPGALVSA